MRGTFTLPRIIIDTDPGVDDAIAILMTLAAPSVELDGLTVVGGNVPHAFCLRNALALLEYAGREDVPVFSGQFSPPVRQVSLLPEIPREDRTLPASAGAKPSGPNPRARWTSWQANSPPVPAK